jgi:hypothetical protein
VSKNTQNIYKVSDTITENFGEFEANYCHSCDNLPFGQCIRCVNCGFDSKGYKGKCVKGEMVSPNNLPSTHRWITHDTAWRNIYALPNENCASAPFIEDL